MTDRVRQIILAFAILLLVVINGSLIARRTDETSRFLGVNTQAETERLILNGRTVFLIKGGELHGFPSLEVFLSHGYIFDEISPALPEDLALREGTIMAFREGTLIKEPANPTVYIVTGAEKRPFTSKDVFLKLGYSFSHVLNDFSSAAVSLPVGQPISSSATPHPVGSLVNFDGTICQIIATGRACIPSKEIFESHGFSFDKVVPATKVDLTLPQKEIVTARHAVALKPLPAPAPFEAPVPTSTPAVIAPLVPPQSTSTSTASSTLPVNPTVPKNPAAPALAPLPSPTATSTPTTAPTPSPTQNPTPSSTTTCLGAATSSNGRFTAPAGGESLTQGSQFMVKWTAPSTIATISLSLLQDDLHLYEIQNQIPNNGSYLWTVPSNYSGSKFQLYSLSWGYSYYARSNYFCIIPPGSSPPPSPAPSPAPSSTSTSTPVVTPPPSATPTTTPEQTTTPQLPSNQVQGLTAAVSGDSVTLNWTAVTTASIGVYNIYRSTTAGFIIGLSTLVAQGNVLSYTHTNVPAGTSYYKVAAQNVDGTIYTASNEVSVNVTPIAAVSGICQVSNAYTSVVKFSAPDLGTGYAKKAKPGVNTREGLLSACTQADYAELLQSYCTINTSPVQEGVLTYGSDGNWLTSTCGAFGCNYRSCP